MPRRNERAVDMWVKFREMQYPELLSREKTSLILGISPYKVREHIANGNLKVDDLTNKVKLYSIAEFLCG